MEYVTHPLVKPGTIESRRYQESILSTVVRENTLVCLPTGLGKTNIAVLLAADRLTKLPDSKILVLAPTKPLVNQHHKTFQHFMSIDPERMQTITGMVNQSQRGRLYKEKQLFFATPQTIQNDIKYGIISFKGFSLLVIDEVHRSVGQYAYPVVAKAYLEEAENPKVLGLTASPSSSRSKIQQICRNAGLEEVEIRTESDPDVAPYVKEKQFEWADVELPEGFAKMRDLLKDAYSKRMERLIYLGYVKSPRTPKRVLLDLQKRLIASIRHGNNGAFTAIRHISEAIKIEHALTLLETQGIPSLEAYWKKVKEEKTKANQRLLKDREVSNAMYMTSELYASGRRHPKTAKLLSIISQELEGNPNLKVIVFANYREMVREITELLKDLRGAKPIEFIGQKGGLSQKEQVKRLEEFREGRHNILVCTSIGEEGLDIPNMDLAIFYEPVPSEIRSIQRRGRVGRHKIGRVIVLVTKGTRDEAYYWASAHKERKMRGILQEMMEGEGADEQKTLEGF